MLDSMTHIARALADMDEPFVRYKTLLNVYGRAPDSREIRILRDEVRESIIARTLLAEQDATGRIPLAPGDKWRGAHWVLYMLAELGSAASDKSLLPLRDQVCDWLFATDRPEPLGPLGSGENFAAATSPPASTSSPEPSGPNAPAWSSRGQPSARRKRPSPTTTAASSPAWP